MFLKHNNKNFNDKYCVFWYKIELDDDQRQQQLKFGILWIQSWKRRYLVVGHVISDGIAHHIGLKRGDRLGYINGVIAPKIKQVEQILKHRKILHLGILRKHRQQTLIVINWLINHKNDIEKEKYSQDQIEEDSIKESNENHSEFQNDRQKDCNDKSLWVKNNKELMHFFVANSDYRNMKDPELYDFLEKNPNDNNWSIYTSESFHPRKDQQSTPNHNKNDKYEEAGSTFLKNKENYQPQFFENDKTHINCPKMSSSSSLKTFSIKNKEFKNILKTYELSKLVSYKNMYFNKYPDNLIKSKIDSHVKEQRALRNIQNNFH